MAISSLINIIGDFCALQSFNRLSKKNILSYTGIQQVDIAVLFGGSIVSGAEIFANAIAHRLAKKNIIVGGYGHTTDALIKQIESRYPGRHFNTSSEAELFNSYINELYNVQADFLETTSTNCGNNVTNLLKLVENENLARNSILFIQDATMQRRMDATFRHHLPSSVTLVNYPAYKVEVIEHNGQLAFKDIPLGMWSMEHYISLLLGEIPRLRDDVNGYGPNGKNFLAHCDIPEEVEWAFQELSVHYPNSVRKANPRFSS